jgi:hypothetical protein
MVVCVYSEVGNEYLLQKLKVQSNVVNSSFVKNWRKPYEE